jgi:hypothetical protein
MSPAFHRLTSVAAISLAALFATACGGSDTGACAPEQCECTASGCACPDGSECGGFTRVASCNDTGSSCNLECGPGSDCAGSCGDSCNLDCDGTVCEVVTGSSGSYECANGATCDVTCQGNSCSMSCQSGSSCDFTCNGESCSMSCADDATCRMRCPGDDGLQEVVEGRSC